WDMHVLLLDPGDQASLQARDTILSLAKDQNWDVLVDDRAERPGVKFNDADLIGCPLQIIVGARSLAQNSLEYKIRRTQHKGSLTLGTDEELKISLQSLLRDIP